MAKKSKKPIVLDLIDGNNWANRAFYGVGFGKLDNGKGLQTNAIKGFNSMLMALINSRRKEGVDHRICVAFDVTASKTFRYDLIEEWVEENPEWAVSCGMIQPNDSDHSHSYKGNRSKDPEVAKSLREQIKWIQRMLVASGIHIIVGAPWEADDYIGSLARTHCDKALCVVQSRDKDFAQLVRKGKIHHVMPEQGNSVRVELTNAKECKEYFGIKPKQVIEYLMLNGDKVDNIPGVGGVGGKTAADILNEYGSLKNLKERRKEIKGNAKWKKAMRGDKGTKGFLPPFALTRKLARIKTDIEDLPSLDDLRIGEGDPKQIAKLKKKLKMKSIMFD